MSVNNPEESIRYSEHGKILKSRIGVLFTPYADNYGMLCKWHVQTFMEVTKRNGPSFTLLAN
jgi:hypothetical protein